MMVVVEAELRVKGGEVVLEKSPAMVYIRNGHKGKTEYSTKV